MTGSLPDRWAEIERLLDQVLDAEPEVRPELLARIRSEDPDAAAEVERLLLAITTDEHFLNDSAPTYAAPLITRLIDDNDLSPGTQLGSYEIVGELGRGGTATVYLAQDRKHGRRVAVKVPHVALASILGPERFLREIQIAAQLQHPNILPLHDSGEVDGVLYYVMPYVEGESLRDRLSREGELPIDDALHIARQVADALAYAHGHGIVHRDIKPENILLSGGHALVADFGIARAITMAAGERQHETGPLGTVAYMSPEQAAADPRLDGRSDIYSLGCVLYEMLVGQPPFDGVNPQAVRASHLVDPIPDPRVLRPTISAELKQVIDTAMAKHPGDRFASAGDLLGALDRSLAPRSDRPRRDRTGVMAVVAVLLAIVVAGALRAALGRSGVEEFSTPASKAPRIAVLYFRDLSPDSSLRQVADGLTEDLIYELSGVKAFRVISRSGVRPFRGREVPFDSMATALGATTVIDGTVQQTAGRLHVRAQLIDARSNTYIDSLSLDRRIADPVEARRTLALEVGAALRRQMGRATRLRSASFGAGNPAAMELAFRAQRLREDAARMADQPHAQDLRAAIGALRRADSLLVSAQRADTGALRPLMERGWVAYDLTHLLRGEARAAEANRGLQFAERSVQLAPSSAEALALRGILRWQLVVETQSGSDDPPDDPQRLREVESDLRAALDRDSTLVRGWTILSDLLWFKGSTAEAEIAARRALQEDTYLADALDIYHQLFFDDLMLGEFGSAAEWCERGHLTFPKHWRFLECELTLMRHDIEATPDPGRAWVLVKELEKIDPPEKAKAQGREYHSIYRRVVAATISARAGQRSIARSEIARARRAAEGDSVLSMDLNYDEAYLRLVLGERARAAQLLQDYIKARPMARDYLARDPLFRNLSFMTTPRIPSARSFQDPSLHGLPVRPRSRLYLS